MSLAKAAPTARAFPWTLALCWLTALTEGYDIQSMGVAAPGLAPALALTREQLGPVFSASLVGLLVGALACGRVADRIGRKWVLIASMAMFGVFSALTALTWDLNSLLAIRVLAGLGLGGAMPNLIALSAESVGDARRARVVTLVTVGYPIGGALSGAAAATLGWRDIFWLGGLAPLMIAPLMVLALPESRSFLAARQAPRPSTAARTDFRWILFGQARAGATLLLWAASFAAVLSLYLLLNWLPTLMGDKGVGKAEASVISVLFNLGGAVGLLALAPMMDQGRRAWMLGAWYAAVALSVVALAGAGADLASAGTAGFVAGVFVVSASASLYGLAPCYYPVMMRGAGVGTSVAVGRLGAIAGPMLAAGLLGVGAGAEGVLLGLLPIVAVAGAAMVFLLGRPMVAD